MFTRLMLFTFSVSISAVLGCHRGVSSPAAVGALPPPNAVLGAEPWTKITGLASSDATFQRLPFSFPGLEVDGAAFLKLSSANELGCSEGLRLGVNPSSYTLVSWCRNWDSSGSTVTNLNVQTLSGDYTIDQEKTELVLKRPSSFSCKVAPASVLTDIQLDYSLIQKQYTGASFNILILASSGGQSFQRWNQRSDITAAGISDPSTVELFGNMKTTTIDNGQGKGTMIPVSYGCFSSSEPSSFVAQN